MSDDPIQKVDTAEAWTEFCDLLKQAGDVVLRDDLETSTFDRAEGLRYLGRMLRAGLFSFGEMRGPKYPSFRAMPEFVKMGLDNPDNYYLSAAVSPQYRYRIRGKRGSIHYLSFAAQNQNFAAKKKIAAGSPHIEDKQLTLADDGSFEIFASKERPNEDELGTATWLEMTENTSQILVRQTFLDRSKELPAALDIECLDSDGPCPPLVPERVPGQLLGSAMYAIGAASWFADWVVEFREKADVNDFHRADPEYHSRLGGDPNIINLLGLWRLESGEALVIEATPPVCDYWNFQLGNIWAESLDFQMRRVHLNNGSVVLDDDGSFRLIVAHEDPGHPNWIDTAGHDHGTMCLRWVRSQSCPMPDCKVVPLAEAVG